MINYLEEVLKQSVLHDLVLQRKWKTYSPYIMVTVHGVALKWFLIDVTCPSHPIIAVVTVHGVTLKWFLVDVTCRSHPIIAVVTVHGVTLKWFLVDVTCPSHPIIAVKHVRLRHLEFAVFFTLIRNLL
jgi:hypothetical protein